MELGGGCIEELFPESFKWLYKTSRILIQAKWLGWSCAYINKMFA